MHVLDKLVQVVEEFTKTKKLLHSSEQYFKNLVAYHHRCVKNAKGQQKAKHNCDETGCFTNIVKTNKKNNIVH